MILGLSAGPVVGWQGHVVHGKMFSSLIHSGVGCKVNLSFRSIFLSVTCEVLRPLRLQSQFL